MRRFRIEIEVEVMETTPESPGIPVFHVERYGALRDVFFVRLADGRWRSLTPLRGGGSHELPLRWMGDLPPLPLLAASAFPELVR